MTIENLHREHVAVYYQIDYELKEIPQDCAYFHAQYRRVNPLPYKEVYTGLTRITRPDGLYHSQQRFSLYRWHICDPVYFEKDIRVTVQALGWRDGERYLPLQDDISSVAFWYQQDICETFPPFPDKDALEII